MVEDEIWVPVNEYEDILQVSNFGNVRTLTRDIPVNGGVRVEKGRDCSKRLKKNGYLQIAVRLGDRKRKWFLVHRLVAKAFIPNPLNLPQVNHKDGNKQNNELSNLEWCTSSDNQYHALKAGLCSNEESHYKAKLTVEQVKSIRSSKDSSRIEAAKYGVDRGTIKAIRNFKTWKYV
jgi:hypothetical protein